MKPQQLMTRRVQDLDVLTLMVGQNGLDQGLQLTRVACLGRLRDADGERDRAYGF